MLQNKFGSRVVLDINNLVEITLGMVRKKQHVVIQPHFNQSFTYKVRTLLYVSKG